MFQISRRVDYAVRIMIELGLLGREERLPVRKLSRRTGVSKAFLHKISADLVKANLVTTYAGPSGGMALRKPPQEIDMLQIVEAVEGPLCLNICLEDPAVCERQKICPAHDVWGELQINIKEKLQAAKLDQLAADAMMMMRHRPGSSSTNGNHFVAEEEIHLDS